MTRSCVSILALAFAAPLAAQQATPFEAADLYRISQVESPAVAPDGKRVVFSRAAFDIGTDRRTNELWLATLDGQGIVDRRLLVSGAQSAAQWSPDGTRIAWLGTLAGKPQIFALALADGIARPVTTGKLAPSAPAWSPDSRSLAFSAQVDATPAKLAGMPTKPEGATWAAEPRITSAFRYRSNEGGYRAAGYRHLFVVDASGGEPRQITRGDFDHLDAQGGLEWARDGRALIVASNRRSDADLRGRESDLWLVPLDGPAKQLTSTDGVERNPTVSPDGRTVAYVGALEVPEFYVQDDLWIVPLSGGSPRNLTARFDRPVSDPVWADDGRSIYAQFNEDGVTRIGQFDLTGSAPKVVVREVGGTRLYLPSAGGAYDASSGTCAYTTLHKDRPAGLGVSRGGREIGTVDLNAGWRATKRIGTLEEVRYTSSAGGVPIQGWIQYPADFDPAKRYPLILDIHGGPNTDYGPMFSVTHQLYAARGYIVLFTNPRGSIGYGAQFANFFGRPYPSEDHDDLMSGVNEMLKRPYVDARNLFIGGGSGGGLLTLWAIGKEPDKFRAAVSLRPVTDWSVQALSSDIQSLTARYWIGAQPWENPTRYWERSPISLVGRVKTPTMLITGEADYRTPIAQTETYYQALLMRGVPAVKVRLPDANHGMGRPSQWLQSVLLPLDFFDRHRVK